MPNNKKKRLADALMIRGKTTSDSNNAANQAGSNRYFGSLDSKLGKTPRNVSPDMHSLFQDNPIKDDPAPKKTTKLEQEMRKRRREPGFAARMYNRPAQVNNWT
jgi:hypothetical protein